MQERDKKIVQKILGWYKKNKRDLPWRKTHDPYRILLSEVMLQQTQVERVIPKYLSFLEQFPTVKALAQAKKAEVIIAWQGLGYNRRALYLQKTAQSIVWDHGGMFPETIHELKQLPGIGEYTARAILSFAFQQKVAVLDTNHRKLYERVFGRRGCDKALLEKGDALISSLPPAKVYDWNQAVMDFVSAMARGESDTTTLWFHAVYPERKQKKKKTKKKSVPFRETNRFLRGRIIDYLRVKKRMSRKQLTILFHEYDKERLERVVEKLQKDGLILIKNGSMILP